MLRFLTDPTPNFKYGVEIGGVLVAGFTSCSGLEVSRETLELVEGGINDHVHVLPGPMQHGKVTLKRGITFTSFLWEWFHWGMTDTAVLQLPVIIIQYNTSGLPIRIIPMLGAYPVKWVGDTLTAGSKQAAIETLEIAFGGRRPGGGTVRRVAAEGGAESGDTGAEQGEGGAVVDSEQQRQLAQKVFKLMKDTMRIERERAGRVGGY